MAFRFRISPKSILTALGLADKAQGLAFLDDAFRQIEDGISSAGGGGHVHEVPTEAAGNTKVHSLALTGLTTGIGNTAVGHSAGVSTFALTTGSRNTFLGVQAGLLTATQVSDALACGTGAKVGGNFSTAVGTAAEARVADTVALGHQAVASFTGGVALGKTAKATNTDSIAIGRGAEASHPGSIAIGVFAFPYKENQIDIGSGSHHVLTRGNREVGTTVHTAPGSGTTQNVLTPEVWLVNAAANTSTLRLPDLSLGNCRGRRHTFKKIDSSAFAVNIIGNGTALIDGVATYSLTAQHQFVTMVAENKDGVWGWYVVAKG